MNKIREFFRSFFCKKSENVLPYNPNVYHNWIQEEAAQIEKIGAKNYYGR